MQMRIHCVKASRQPFMRADFQWLATRRPLIGGHLNVKSVRVHWNEILRLATSIKQGTVTASLMLRKLGSYPRQNGLAVALRELGRIERTLFILDWLQSVELRRRVNAGLNKAFEQQRHQTSGLNLVTAAIVLWNTAYLERAVRALRRHDQKLDETLCKHRSPLGWPHINLMGDYVWKQNRIVGSGKYRPLRLLPIP